MNIKDISKFQDNGDAQGWFSTLGPPTVENDYYKTVFADSTIADRPQKLNLAMADLRKKFNIEKKPLSVKLRFRTSKEVNLQGISLTGEGAGEEVPVEFDTNTEDWQDIQWTWTPKIGGIPQLWIYFDATNGVNGKNLEIDFIEVLQD
ncbi:hypothetical protein [Pseudomonas sp. AL03]|uniref:hypothetical protein n=1 Tax=Pseudomonas sp. AL03 TaxID=3042230 RepID=UPI002499BC1E|nr:hypothetical protein [Pseudomonas sp. AL03]MDI3274197.1 hypothetical protein [Pseudomonas sp. AL03]